VLIAVLSKQRIEALEERLATMESMLQQEPSKDLPRSMDPTSPEPQADSNGSSLPLDPKATSIVKGLVLPFHRISQRLTLLQREDLARGLDRITLSPLAAETSELFLVRHSLDDICAELPFLRVPWLLDLIERPNAPSLRDDWWQGIINPIIASAVYFKAANSAFRDVAVYSWALFRNAYAVLPELMIRADSLGAAQAVMAMAMFMRQSADTRTTALLLSIAIRMQHSAGLYLKVTTESILSLDEVENRSRLFWAGFILDTDMSLNTGLPSLHGDRVGTVDRPDGSPSASKLPVGGGRRDAVFRLRAELAGIQSRIGTQPITPRQADLFVSKLEAWSLIIPPGLRPDWQDHSGLASSAEAADVSVSMLHLVYYNSISMLCWASVQHATSGTPASDQVIDSSHDRLSRHRSIASGAARAAIRSLTHFRTRPFTELW